MDNNKEKIIQQLELLIRNIKVDKESTNYIFEWELLEERQVKPNEIFKDIRVSVYFTEIHKNNVK